MAYVLIVDDDEDFANTAAAVLRTDGHEVRIELDTEEGRQSMEQRCPDLLILDVMFPEDASAGFNLARVIRHEEGTLKDVPILMLTAINTKFPLGFGPQDIDDGWMPVTGFLEKPVDLEVLRSRVTELLSGAQAAD